MARRVFFAAAGLLAAVAMTLAVFGALSIYLPPIWAAAATALLLSTGSGLLGMLAALPERRHEPEPPATLAQTVLDSIRGPEGLQIGLSLLSEAFEGWIARRRRKRETR